MTTIELSGGPGAVAEARHAIERFADEEQLPRVEDLRLLVSELVTNSVIHGGAGPEDKVRMSIEQPNGSLRVMVCDHGRGWTRRMRSTSLHSDEPPGGWGLLLVREIADRWGIDSNDGTCVWFEMAMSEQPAALSPA
jgi:anti-sigma regulatory factor (Ser/Thr protein kinase)